MQYHTHQGQFILSNSQFSRRQRIVSSHRNDHFHLPTTIAQNDPFLRRLYHVVAVILDDHPYPSTPEEFDRRTQQIKENIQDLHLTLSQHKFLRRLIKETDVTLVNIFSH